MEPAWVDGLKVSIIVCDREGKILFLNSTAARQYAKDGGSALVGKNLRDCHKADSKEKIAQLIAEARPNHYTITKKGRKRIIHQMPWFEDGRCAGLVELAMDIPDELPHFDRDQQAEAQQNALPRVPRPKDQR
ncbi:MAG TPA: PAS domain-containing protein [Phycisphaerae bacterium]|nr:PAS domain-containing protein [Phycisphaerae bacterium]